VDFVLKNAKAIKKLPLAIVQRKLNLSVLEKFGMNAKNWKIGATNSYINN
jgi:hypothetical protein